MNRGTHGHKGREIFTWEIIGLYFKINPYHYRYNVHLPNPKPLVQKLNPKIWTKKLKQPSPPCISSIRAFFQGLLPSLKVQKITSFMQVRIQI